MPLSSWGTAAPPELVVVYIFKVVFPCCGYPAPCGSWCCPDPLPARASPMEQWLECDQWESPARHWPEKSVSKELKGSCWVWTQQLIGDEGAPAEHLPIWCGSPLKYMKNTKWFVHYQVEKTEVHAWLVCRVSFSHFLTNCHALLTHGCEEFKQGPFVFAVSFAFFTSFTLLLFLCAVHGINPSSCSSVPRQGFMSHVSSKIWAYFSAF